MIPIELPIGVVNKPTDADQSASWREVNLIRWNEGQMVPVMGWDQVAYSAPTTNIRAVHVWTDLTGREWTAYLTEDNIYVDYNGTLTSINPTPAMTAFDTTFSAGGYGDDVWSFGLYGTARATRTPRRAIGPAFTLNNWGQDLLIMTSFDGRLLKWVPSTPPTPATVVAGAPIGCRTFVVTPERFVQVFCPGGDTSSYAWCDQEDITNWTPGTTSKAGDLPVEPASPVVAAIYEGAGTLFFTARKSYLSAFIGLPYVFDTDELGEGSTPISAGVLKRIVDGAMWFSESGFWRFNGVSITPIQCDIWPWILDNIDWDAARYVAAAVNLDSLSEYWLFFPSKGSSVNDKMAIFNFRQGWWSMADIGRSCGFSSSYTSYPLMADKRVVYKHELGNEYPGSDMPWAETFTINVAYGENGITVNQLQPEFEGDDTQMRFSLAVRQKRNGPLTYSPQRSVQSNGLVDMDVTGRDVRIRLDQIATSDPWTLGPILIDIKGRGKMA